MGEKNKVEIRINGMDYTLLTEEEPEYVHKIAFYVDQKMKEIHSANPRLSTAMAAVLASVTIGDEYLKSVSAADRMRDQIQQYLEEGTADKLALEEARRECEKLKKELHDMQIKYAKKETELEDVINNFEIEAKNNNVTFDDLE